MKKAKARVSAFKAGCDHEEKQASSETGNDYARMYVQYSSSRGHEHLT
jgi:hypothetical protein